MNDRESYPFWRELPLKSVPLGRVYCTGERKLTAGAGAGTRAGAGAGIGAEIGAGAGTVTKEEIGAGAGTGAETGICAVESLGAGTGAEIAAGSTTPAAPAIEDSLEPELRSVASLCEEHICVKNIQDSSSHWIMALFQHLTMRLW